VISGAASSTYTPEKITGTTYYYAVVTNTYTDPVDGAKTKTTTSAVAAITFAMADDIVTPVISGQPQGASYAASAAPAALTVTASVDSGTLSYQWYRNPANSNTGGTVISGAVSSTYTPEKITGTAYYYAVVTNTYTDPVDGAKIKTTTSAVAAITFAASASTDAASLASALNAISAGSAEADGSTVELLDDVTLTAATPLTVPAGVTLDLVTGHKSITLNDNAVLTVNGELNAEAAYGSPGNLPDNGRIVVASENTPEKAAKINGTGVIHLKSQGSLVYVGSGRGLTLDGAALDGLMTADMATDNGIDLPSGYADTQNNNRGLCHIVNGGLFTMESGVIGYNGNDAGIYSDGIFNMSGGAIQGNCHIGGDSGGIYVGSRGVFTMSGGEIKNNRAHLGGGVYVTIGGGYDGKFIMEGGTVYGSSAGPGLANTATSSGAALYCLFAHAYWGDGTTSIPNKGNQNGTLRGERRKVE
jgi:hypothetical protein